MGQDVVVALITDIAVSKALDVNLCLAIAYVETGLDPTKVRFEPNWEYLVNPARYSQVLGITVETEMQLQRFSYGPLQIMGSNARVLGYNGMLTLLSQSPLGAMYGVKFIQTLKKKFTDEKDVISSYNQGQPTKINGSYKNQNYVDKVCNRLRELRGMK